MEENSTAAIENMNRVVEILNRMYRHRQANPTIESEALYYQYMADYNERIARAKEEGKLLVGHTVFAPIEIFFALDMVPMHLESTSGTITILLNRFADYLNAARAFGLAPECCSAHRILAATLCLKDLPRPDLLVWTSQACDNTAKSGDALMELYGMPGFFLDRPYRFVENQVAYYTRQMRDLIAFLEERAGKKMDYDRLREILARSIRMMNLYHEMYELRKAAPAPMRNRSLMNQMIVEWAYCGTPEGITWFETVRDEIRENVRNGRGGCSQEKYRLLSLFLPPMYENKLLDWMEREYGAVIAMDPMSSWPDPIEIDPSDPVEGVARLSFYRAASRLLHGPGEEFIQDALRNAREFRVDAALYFAHIGCRQACALIKETKDTLQRELGLVTSVIDMDLMDPSFAPTDQLKEKLEEFFERLEDRLG